jgi:V/A-type H+/Na+-transporting ATPase subunit F
MSTTNSEYKIAIVGPKDTVSGFKALGVEAFDAQTAEEALQQLKTIKQQTLDPESSNKYAVVCIIEDLVTLVDQTEYAKVVEGALPAVVLLPGPEGSSGFVIERLRRLAEQAVGSAII